MKYKNIREEELKNKVGADWFKQFDTTEILGNIDFTVFPKQDSLFGRTPLLWAEAKTGNFDIPAMFVQLILTIGKARTFDKTLPPAFLGAFDFKKIAFIDYVNIQDIFYLNDFNWNVTPSNHESKEFQLIKTRIESILKSKTYIFDYEKDEKLLHSFIKNNVAKATTKSKIKIDKNNFIPIYLRWIEIVKPIIDVNWDDLKKANIFDNDFYLADIFVDDKDTQSIDDDLSIRDSLFVVYQNQGYKIAKENIKQMFDATINIRNKDAYLQFWKLYKRPPIKEFQEYIIERRDLLAPQDIRERKGAFFTPRIWVELSQKYLTNYLGEDWQDDYYVWDCAAGTGNLLAGLTNKYNIYASTLDQADVNVMHERIEHGANLLKNHVFQFDFLNDDFTKLPQSLQDIINDKEKRKKLVIYINPPYAEASDKKTLKGKEGKSGVEQSTINKKYAHLLGQGNAELFAQFLIRINKEISGSIIAEFSKLKILQGSHFSDFRKNFKARLEKMFLVPADTFDNVKGKFPIGFMIWNSSIKISFNRIIADVYNNKGDFLLQKEIIAYDNSDFINEWIKPFRASKNDTYILGKFPFKGNDFQNQNMIIVVHKNMMYNKAAGQFLINSKNLIKASIYFSVRKCIEATWLNDRDQFLKPNNGWQNDTEFQNDCLTYTLFNNNIQSKYGINHWIPFTEQEVNAQNRFESNFMTDFIKGKLPVSRDQTPTLFTSPNQRGLGGENSPSQRGLGGENSPSQRGLGGENSPSERGLGGVLTPQYLQSQNIPTKNLIFSDQFLPYNPQLKERSKSLRKARNLSEVLLWKALRANSFKGYSFYRQKPILNYIADFYCKELNLVIEIDGSSHHTEQAKIYDAERDRQMQALGLTVLRVSDFKVKKDLASVLFEIEGVIDGLTPPSPLSEGEPQGGGVLSEGEPQGGGVPKQEGLVFSEAAKAVFDVGRELWKYYHSQPNVNVNASLYDIREYFQGRNNKGRMNSKSDDEKYMELIGELRNKLNFLADKIKPKIYEYEFLKE